MKDLILQLDRILRPLGERALTLLKPFDVLQGNQYPPKENSNDHQQTHIVQFVMVFLGFHP